MLLLWLMASVALAAPTFPKLTGRVVDDAQVLPPDVEAALTQKLAALEAANGTQLVVVTLPDLGGYDIGDYGYQLGRAWGIGQKGANNGAMLIVAPADRKVRVEVGYGLEPILTDGLTSRIIRNDIIPQFKAGNIPAGVVAGTDALVAQLQLPPAAAAAKAKSAAPADAGFSPVALFWLALIILWIFIAIKRSKRGRRMGGAGPVVIWGPGTGGWGRDNGRSNGWGGGGFGGGGGWGGGGGFGGGGGGFGGGGSSGGW